VSPYEQRCLLGAEPLQIGRGCAKSTLMASDRTPPQPPTAEPARTLAGNKRALPAAAERALAEAAARRVERERAGAAQPNEVNGRGGLEPTRYGDWEIGGLASDF
jgi:hypothetical protein